MSNDPVGFINTIVAPAQEVQRKIGMFTSVTIAQACLETGYSSHTPKDITTNEESYNMFGMKATAGQPFVTSETWEIFNNLPEEYIRYEQRSDGKYKVWILANFRKFSSFDECFLARADFLSKSKYWECALDALTPEHAIHGLQHTGYFTPDGYEISYATDDDYENKLLSIIERYNLKQYDLPHGTISEEEQKMINELIAKIETLEKEVITLKEKLDKPQTLSSWAEEGFGFVTRLISGKYISDGKRPKDFVTREEVWAMLQRLHDLYGKK